MNRAASSLTAGTGSCRLAQQAGGARQRQRQPRGRRPAPPPQAGFFRDLFDFESWAPKSSQAWRLGNNPSDRRRESAEGACAAGVAGAGVAHW
jgi:hypothetical protein